MTDVLPLVDVADSAEDWTCIFTLLYESVSAANWLKKLLLLQALSLVRIARKYQFDKIYKYAMRRLEAAFPTTYENFLEAYNGHLVQTVSWTECHCGETCDKHEVVKLINYAVEWDIPAILPVAYYLVSGLDVTQVLRGIKRPYAGMHMGSPSKSESPSFLCRHAKEALLIGIPQLESRFYDLVLPWAHYEGPDCFVGLAENCSGGGSSDCLTKLQQWEREYCSRPLMHPYGWPWVFLQNHHIDLCTVCSTQLTDHLHQKRLELWEELPRIFGLPGWDAIAGLDD